MLMSFEVCNSDNKFARENGLEYAVYDRKKDRIELHCKTYEDAKKAAERCEKIDGTPDAPYSIMVDEKTVKINYDRERYQIRRIIYDK